MIDIKKIDFSGIVVLAIFVLAIVGLTTINNSFESFSVSSESKLTEPAEITSQDQIVRTLNEIDSELMTFFDKIREYLN
jgi:hypothetical protein